MDLWRNRLFLVASDPFMPAKEQEETGNEVSVNRKESEDFSPGFFFFFSEQRFSAVASRIDVRPSRFQEDMAVDGDLSVGSDHIDDGQSYLSIGSDCLVSIPEEKSSFVSQSKGEESLRGARGVRPSVNKAVPSESIVEGSADVLSLSGKKYMLVESRKVFVRNNEVMRDNALLGGEIVPTNAKRSSSRQGVFMLKDQTRFVLGRWYHTMVSLPPIFFPRNKVFTGCFFKKSEEDLSCDLFFLIVPKRGCNRGCFFEKLCTLYSKKDSVVYGDP